MPPIDVVAKGEISSCVQRMEQMFADSNECGRLCGDISSNKVLNIIDLVQSESKKVTVKFL